MPKPISYRIPNYVFRIPYFEFSIRFCPQKTNSIGLNVENDCGSVRDISVSFSSLLVVLGVVGAVLSHTHVYLIVGTWVVYIPHLRQCKRGSSVATFRVQSCWLQLGSVCVCCAHPFFYLKPKWVCGRAGKLIAYLCRDPRDQHPFLFVRHSLIWYSLQCHIFSLMKWYRILSCVQERNVTCDHYYDVHIKLKFFRYESSEIKFVWYNLQILSVSQRYLFESWVWCAYKKKRSIEERVLMIFLFTSMLRWLATPRWVCLKEIEF
jgi:hypothetical protein